MAKSEHDDGTGDWHWLITDHVCRMCMGRLLAYEIDETLIRCSCCGTMAEGGVEALCACGSDLGDAPIRLQCAPNPKPTAENMAEIIVVEVPVERKPVLGGVPVRSSRGDDY